MSSEKSTTSKIAKGKHTIPDEKKQRLTYAIKNIAPLVMPGLAFLFGWIWTAAHNGLFSLGSGIMFLLVLVGLAILIWGMVYFYRRASFSYQLFDRFTVTFTSADYYVPKSTMESNLRQYAIEPFDTNYEFSEGVSAEDLLRQNDLTVSNEKPQVEGVGEVLGVTYPFAGKSIIYGPYVEHEGVVGHEIRLQMCHALFPGRSEKGDIRWMKETGIM